MGYKYFTFLMAILLCSSCTIEDLLERKEDRLIGSWEIDRARFDADGFSFSENIIRDYRGDVLTFFEDGTLEYVEANGELFLGDWYLDAIRGQEDNLFTLDADFYDIDGNLVFRWLGDIDRLTFNNFNISISDRNGELRLKWDKI